MTRREVIFGVSGLVILGALGASVRVASADTVSTAELMQPSKLGDIALGAENAPVTIVEYASMTCPHCATFAVTTFPKLKEKYIDTGKVRFILREFPLDPLAAGAFMLARCAGKDKYYSLVDTLFEQQSKWAVQNPIPPLLSIAKQAGFTQDSFESCLKNQQLLDQIEEVRNRGADKFKVESTPTFFVNGERFVGAMTIADLDKAIQARLKS
jgi:protein-disulfide isomerase